MKKAKRILLPLILALLLVAVAVFATACSGNDSPDKNYSPASDFTWEIVDGKVNITGYRGNDKEVVIPPVINGAPVTSIGDYAYYYCINLASIKLPNSITSIGDHAFFGCTNLTSITIPDSVTSIGYAAFYLCDNLTSITIPDSVTSIGVYAFSYCTNLVSIIVDENNSKYRSIDGNLYSKDGKILVAYAAGKQETSLIIPEGVTSIGDHAFSYCSNLASITIPGSVVSIECWAFSGCTGLTSITIPDSVTSISDYAFSGCDNLTIYCEATTQPEGWEDGWNSSECPVVWGCEAKE